MNAQLPPDQAVFMTHLGEARFQEGVRESWWQLVSINWPHVVLRVFADRRPSAPVFFDFLFDCAGYPNDPPTARLWDSEANAALPFTRWPTGGQRVTAAFNPSWEGGRAVYLPCDRIAIRGHADWPQKYPSKLWKPKVGIAHYLELLHGLLNTKDYSGLRGAAA